jgi:GT2 family glycosyltransferase
MDSVSAAGTGAEAVLVSIVIPVFNHIDLTRQCIDSIRKNTPDCYEVVVIDNGSTDGTAECLRDQPVRLIVNEENLGFHKAANQGITSAQGEYVCLLNNDVIVLPGWLEPLLDCLAADDRVGIVGPKQIRPDSTVWHAGTVFGPDDSPAFARQPMHVFIDFPEGDPLVNVKRYYPAMNFGCCLIPARLFREVGLLDDETFMFPGLFEDVDWCLRLRKGSYLCLYCPDSKVIHMGNRTQYHSGESLKRKSLEAIEVNLERLLRKWEDEPESFFVPDDVRPVLDEYFSSAIFLGKENADMRRQVEVLRERVRELEEVQRYSEAVNAEAAVYARKLEADWKDKCEELEAEKGRVARLEAELTERTRGKPKLFRRS